MNSSESADKLEPLTRKHIAPPKRLPFGEYLVSKGRVSREQLDKALELQRSHNPKIGSLAGERLSFEKICDIREYQERNGARFGQAAVALGYLSEREVDELLMEQLATNRKTGEILVQLKAMTTLQLQEYVDEYFRETGPADLGY